MSRERRILRSSSCTWLGRGAGRHRRFVATVAACGVLVALPSFPAVASSVAAISDLRPSVSVTASCPAPGTAVHSAAGGTGKTVALTFDDGPGPDTAAVLAVLRKYHVTATFFQIGSQVMTFPTTARAVDAAGMLVGDHTYSHPRLPSLSLTGQRTEMAHALAAQTSVRVHPGCVMRPPGGAYDADTRLAAQSLRLSIWNWSASGGDANNWGIDWRTPPPATARIYRTIARNAMKGIGQAHPVVLLHDGRIEPDGKVRHARLNTVAALSIIIPAYQAAGYRFVTVLGTS